MKDPPPLPPIEDASPALFESGHLWLLEDVAGSLLRFRLAPSGLLTFGDRDRTYDRAEDVPAHLQHAVRHVRERLDRDALRAAVEDVEQVVFFGVATHQRTIDYDWDRLPPFLGTEVWTGDGFRPPDVVHGISERLGLHPVTPVERELPARDFDPESYAVPASAWYDGPAAGVVVRDKTGGRAILRPGAEASDQSGREDGGETAAPDVSTPAAGTPEASTTATASPDAPTPATASPDDIAAAYATDERFDAAVDALSARDEQVTVDAVAERVLEAVLRRHYRVLYGGSESVDEAALRSAIAGRAARLLE